MALSAVDDSTCYHQIVRYNISTESDKARARIRGDKRQYPQYDEQASIRHKVAQKQKRLSKEEIQEIITAYRNGVTIYELAEQFNCHRNTISDNLKRNGIQPTIKKFTSQSEIDKLISHYESGMKNVEIAKLYGVSESTVRKTLLCNGIRMRNRWDYEQ